MNTITKEFHFSAAHVLTGLAKGHQCGRMHGHNYIVKVELSSYTTNELGFVQDYGELDPIKEYIDKHLDHRFIAESEQQAVFYNLVNTEVFILGKQSSAENLAKHIFDTFKEEFPLLSAVSISETPKTWATYSNYLSDKISVDIDFAKLGLAISDSISKNIKVNKDE